MYENNTKVKCFDPSEVKKQKLYGIIDIDDSSGIGKVIVMASSKEEAIRKIIESFDCASIQASTLSQLEELATDVVACPSCY